MTLSSSILYNTTQTIIIVQYIMFCHIELFKHSLDNKFRVQCFDVMTSFMYRIRLSYVHIIIFIEEYIGRSKLTRHQKRVRRKNFLRFLRCLQRQFIELIVMYTLHIILILYNITDNYTRYQYPILITRIRYCCYFIILKKKKKTLIFVV